MKDILEENQLGEKDDTIFLLRKTILELQGKTALYRRYITWVKDLMEEGCTIGQVNSILTECQKNVEDLKCSNLKFY